jgi:segregation and condensation protein A
MREVVDLLERRGEHRRNHFARAYLPAQPVAPQAPLALSLVELLGAVDRVLRAVSRPDMHDVVPRALDVPGAIEVIRAVLTLRARALLSDMLTGTREPWQVLSMLLGLLELARVGELRVQQARAFGNVEITPVSPATSRDAASEAA